MAYISLGLELLGRVGTYLLTIDHAAKTLLVPPRDASSWHARRR